MHDVVCCVCTRGVVCPYMRAIEMRSVWPLCVHAMEIRGRRAWPVCVAHGIIVCHVCVCVRRCLVREIVCLCTQHVSDGGLEMGVDDAVLSA
jgi:hypothetical protein